MTTALIDADIVAYSMGFAGDKTYYTVGGKKFKYHKKAKEWCKAQGLDFKLHIEKHHEAGNIKNTLNSVDFLVQSILNDVEANDAKLYLTGSNNYRDSIAVTQPYKGNRDTAKKPHHLLDIRKHLVTSWGAEIVEGQEADDALGIAQSSSKEDTVICSIDKDLLMIPGWHYNWNSKQWIEIDEYQGWFNFYNQLLTGDRTDHIEGIAGIGPATAAKILRPFGCPEGMLCEVGRHYALHFDDPEARMLENGQLLYIKRSEDDSWNFNRHKDITDENFEEDHETEEVVESN